MSTSLFLFFAFNSVISLPSFPKRIFDDLAKAQVGSLTIGNDALLASWSQQIVSSCRTLQDSSDY